MEKMRAMVLKKLKRIDPLLDIARVLEEVALNDPISSITISTLIWIFTAESF